jgi:hypothetical protein
MEWLIFTCFILTIIAYSIKCATDKKELLQSEIISDRELELREEIKKCRNDLIILISELDKNRTQCFTLAKEIKKNNEVILSYAKLPFLILLFQNEIMKRGHSYNIGRDSYSDRYLDKPRDEDYLRLDLEDDSENIMRGWVQ